MKRLVLSALCAVAMAACGGGGDGDTGITLNDAGPTFDGGDIPAACNAVTQAGCESGEKCAQLVESDEPFLARTACVPDGSVTEGQACTNGAAGATTGYDDCVAGNDCLNGVCTKICDVGPPDGCRAEGEAFGEGSYCTLFENLFSDNIGLCTPGCNPVDDTTAEGAVTNASCGAGNGCFINSIRGIAGCAGVPAPAAMLTQNEDCYGPASGGCYLNGCASGFSASLNNKVTDADGSVCARYCTSTPSYLGNLAGVQGVDNKCTSGALNATGGAGGNNTEHQCRHYQTFYNNTGLVPNTIGMCVPVIPLTGGSWGDCKLLDWDGIQAAFNGKADLAAAQASFDAFCYEDPADPDAVLLPKCVGFFRGCISLEEEDAKLDDYAAAAALSSRKAFAARHGIEITDAPLESGIY